MTLYLRLAWRNVWRQRRRTLLIAVGMGVVMAMLIMYDGLLGGFEQAIYGNAIQLLGGNIQVHAPGYGEKAGRKPLLPIENPDAVVQAAEAQPEVVAASKRIVSGGLATNREGAFAVSLIGIEADKEVNTPVAENITKGRYLTPDDGDVIVIGQGLATAMSINVGDRITMVSNSKNEQTRQRTMTVVGIYDVGVPSVEKATIYMSLAEAQSLFGLDGQVTEIVISLKQIGQEQTVIDGINGAVTGYEVETWESSFPELKQTMDMKSGVMSYMGVFLLCIAAIGILNQLMMAVFERTREIGVISALGMKPREITLLFLSEGILIGLMGAAFGAALGISINLALGVNGLDYTQFADLTEYTALISGSIYPQLDLAKVFQHALTVAVIAALAALYPATQASHHEPAEALHYV